MNSSPRYATFILNWSPIEKCLLMLALAISLHLAWLVWKVYVYWHPELWRFVNIQLLVHHIYVNFIVLPMLGGLMLLCWLGKKVSLAQKILPYVGVFAFSLSMCRDAYLSGIMSPATTLTFVVSFIIGLLLFKRAVIYSGVLLTLTVFCWIMKETIQGRLPYAPLFIASQSVNPTQASVFWTLSMLWFILPIFIGGVILLEILLSQWRIREKNVEVLSQVDPLTSLYNRRSIYDFLRRLLQSQPTLPASHALILLDLDYFKQINDLHGHSMGDQVLVETALVLQRVMRKHDVVGRFGGEEFIIVLSHISGQQAQQIAERCRQEFAKIRLLNETGQEIQVTASFGIAHFDQSASNIDSILKQADEALYYAKKMGRNQVVQYHDYMTSRLPV